MRTLFFVPLGLSPRVRGNPGASGADSPDARSIPACAGEPGFPVWASTSGGVYPRVCGGTHCSRWAAISFCGLSPRVRGNLFGAPCPTSPTRSIPACAGEPEAAMTRARDRRVYPRVCGGTPAIWGGGPAGRGLSPRVRGNPPASTPAGRGAGSIPACAGEPMTARTVTHSAQVYPRVCGGTYRPGAPQSPDLGLSPRVRGNLRIPIQRPARYRSIPACAGEPKASARSGSRP